MPASMRAISRAMMPAGSQPQSLAGFHQQVPQRFGVLRGDPQLVSQVAGIAGAGDRERDAAGVPLRQTVILQVGEEHAAEDLLQDAPRVRTLQRQGCQVIRHVAHLHIQAVAAILEPGQVGLGGGDAKYLLRQARHRTIIDHLTVVVAPGRIHHLTDGAARRRRASGCG